MDILFRQKSLQDLLQYLALSLSLSQGLPSCHIIRVMPSLPNEVAAGIAMHTKSIHATAKDVDIVEALFKPLGCCEPVQENLLDVTAQLGGAACAWVGF